MKMKRLLRKSLPQKTFQNNFKKLLRLVSSPTKRSQKSTTPIKAEKRFSTEGLPTKISGHVADSSGNPFLSANRRTKKIAANSHNKCLIEV
jgi:hypothetical protein